MFSKAIYGSWMLLDFIVSTYWEETPVSPPIDIFYKSVL